MTVANRALAGIAGIAFVLVLTVAAPSYAAMDGWYSFAFAHLFRFANGAPALPAQRDEKAIEKNYLTRLFKDENSITLKGLVPSEADLKVIQGPAGLFISMPSKRKKNGEFKDIAHPLNRETREMLEKRILEEYERVRAAAPPVPRASVAPTSAPAPAVVPDESKAAE